MKRIIIFLLLFAALKVAGQTTGYLRFDTVKIMKQNGTCEMYIINKTKDSLGVLTNIGGGLTRFIKPKMLNDSMLIVGLDTLTIHGAGGGSANARYSITKSSDSLQLLNDETTVKRNHSYTTMDDGTRRWNPSYWSFIDRYYADTATASQTNVGGSSTVRLSNGTWLTAYTGSGDNPEDGNSSTIYAINSNDNLRTFYNKRQIVSLDTLDAHFGPSLYVKGTNLSTGDTVILIWGSQITAIDYGYVGDIRTRQSNDGGVTWGSISVLRAAAGEYYNNFPSRIFRTNSGKLLYPFERLRPGSIGPDVSAGFDPRMLVSTNNGTTWSYSTAIPNAPDSGCVETGFYQRAGETRLYWYARSFRKTYVYTAYSDDDGVTWSTPDYMNYSAPNAATTIKYMRSIDAFVGFSNRVNGAGTFPKRQYLYGFLSADGQNFKQFMTVDTATEGSPGVIGLSDILDFDSAVVVMYSKFAPTTQWGSLRVARIPRNTISSSFENIGSGLGVPSGGDADRIAPYIPNIRWNTTGYYEGSMGSMFGYGSLLLTGDMIDGVYPFKTMKLKSNSQIGRLTLYNKDAVMGYYGEYQCEKSYNTSYNMGAGQIVGKYGFNTVAEWRGITNADAPGGFSNVDMTFWAINSSGSNGERFRITADGNVGINTDVPATKLHVVGTTRFDLGSDANYDIHYRNSSGQFTRLAAGTDGYVLTTHSTTSAPTWEAASGSDGNGIYSDDGVLSSNRHVSGGASGHSLQIDSSSSISLFSGLEFISSGIGSSIQMSDSVMSIGSSSATDFTSFTFSPTRIKFIAADGSGSAGDVWTNTGSGYGHWATQPLVAAGTFTPTLTAVTNTSSPLLDGARYTRIGNIVTFSLRFSVTTSSGSSASSIRVTLPVASSFSNINQAAGTCSGSLGRVESDATNDELIVAWTSGAGGTETIVVTGQYTIL